MNIKTISMSTGRELVHGIKENGDLYCNSISKIRENSSEDVNCIACLRNMKHHNEVEAERLAKWHKGRLKNKEVANGKI